MIIIMNIIVYPYGMVVVEKRGECILELYQTNRIKKNRLHAAGCLFPLFSWYGNGTCLNGWMEKMDYVGIVE